VGEEAVDEQQRDEGPLQRRLRQRGGHPVCPPVERRRVLMLAPAVDAMAPL
jgi:hypothetical protein